MNFILKGTSAVSRPLRSVKWAFAHFACKNKWKPVIDISDVLKGKV